MRLIKIPKTGHVPGDLVKSDLVKRIIESTRKMYARCGYQEPWVGYLAFIGNQYIGTCAFKSAPLAGKVEIAYFTFPEFEGRGIASKMAKALIEIAHGEDSRLIITAQTMPAVSPSNSVLQKMGFQFVESIEVPREGEVWQWQLKPMDRSLFN